MINNINSNSYGSLSKVGQGNNNQVNPIQDKSSIKIDLKSLSKEQLTKLNKSQKEEVVNLLNRLQSEIAKAEIISVKIVRGEKLTSEEKKFLNEKYPDLKQVAEESVKDVKKLKQEIQKLKNNEQQSKLILKAISDIKLMGKSGILSEVQSRIKMSGIEEVEKFMKQVQKELNKSEIIAIKIVKGEKLTTNEQKFINEKHPELKQESQKSKEYISSLKEVLESCKSNDEKQQVVLKEVKNIENLSKNGIISESEAKVRMAALDEAIKSENDNSDIKKESLIANKIVKGEKLTPSEQRFISEKYPDIKQPIEESIVEIKEIREALKSCRNEKEKQQVISKIVSELDDMVRGGTISESKARLSLLLIDKLKEEEKESNNNVLKSIINPYFYLGMVSDNISSLFIIVVIVTVLYLFL